MEKVTIGESELWHGDCFDILPELDVIADAVISDPPYGITAHSWDEAPPLDKMWQLFESKSKQNANYVLFGCGGFAFDLVNSRRKHFRYDLSWVKNNKTGWLNSNLMPHRNHENVLIFGRPGYQKAATFNPPEGSVHPCTALPFDHDRGCNQPEKCLHPTMKPLHLMGYLIMLYTNPGDLIIEPFAGSGTTLDAAYRLNRRFIGIEKEREFFDIACKRLEAIHQRKTARRTTFMSFPVNPTNADQTAPEAESTIPPTPESEHQNYEDSNLTEDLS